MTRLLLNRLFCLLLVLPCLLVPHTVVAGELETLGYTEGDAEQVVSARIPRPASQIAENVTVVTSEDIARLNAHTLADVLQTIPGIQLDYLRTPTSFAFFNIQGAHSTTVLVLIDGVRLNDFDQNMATPGQIPVQMIERVEITKGSASSAYGPALGGVINIVTKSPDPDRKVSGMVSGSIGSRSTADSRAELSGSVDRFGYYLNAGNIRSDGLRANNAANQSNLYGKFTFLLPTEGKVTFGLSHLNSHSGQDEADATLWNPGWGTTHDSNSFKRSYGFLKFSQPLRTHLTLDIDGYMTSREDHTMLGGLDGQGAPFFFTNGQIADHTRGGSARLSWLDGGNGLVVGADYGHVWASNEDLQNEPPLYSRAWDSWATYVNGAYSLGRLTILPGIRHDSTGINGDYTSYTLGATYQLSGNTTLRAYAGKGFSLPLASNNGLQRIKTVQGGIESCAVPYLWLKGTYFFNAVRNNSVGNNTGTTTIDEDRQGFEFEAKTVPVLGVSLSSGYTYQHVKNTDTGQMVKTDSNESVPSHLVKLAIKYDNDDLGLRGTLTGNWLYWNAASLDPASNNGNTTYPVSDKGMIWDLHLNWKVFPEKDLSPELFFSGHNLFNGNQTTFRIIYPSVPRWFEGGVRLRF